MKEAVVMVYLAFSAVGVFVGALALLEFGDPTLPALAHLVFAVGVAPLIFGAISHFVPVLTRSGRAHRGLMWATLLLQLAGAAAFLSFNGALDIAARDAAALGAFLVAIAFAVWLVRRARRTLGRPHPGWRWYLAAVVALSLALALVPAMTEWPEWRSEFRLLHLHLNTLGFIGLAALGTLQVLLPTTVGEHDAHAAARLHHDLPIAAGAVLAVAVGAAFWLPLALTGGVLLLFVVLNTGVAWWRPKATAGAIVFADNCVACHKGEQGLGDRTRGAPNLTDAVWLYAGDRATITETVTKARFGVMPNWNARLSEDQIRAVAVYVHSLGGGE